MSCIEFRKIYNISFKDKLVLPFALPEFKNMISIGNNFFYCIPFSKIKWKFFVYHFIQRINSSACVVVNFQFQK